MKAELNNGNDGSCDVKNFSASLINPRYTFDNFVVGKSNVHAYELALRVLDKPGKAYNPLLIHGGVGLGKTHILGSIANAYFKKGDCDKILLLSCELFTEQVISSIREKRLHELESHYTSFEMLLIDDIHFIANSEQTQEVFINIFKYLYNQTGQIVLTSDRPPATLNNITKSLKGCFELGHLAEVMPPTTETKISILQKNAERENLVLSDDVVYFLASAIGSNIRELEGSLYKISAHANFTGSAIDLEIAKKLLKDLIHIKPDVVDVESIVRVVCQHFNVNERVINSNKRTKDVLLPRQLTMYITKKLTKLSHDEIGRRFGKDHSTVVYSCKQVEKKLQQNDEFAKTIDKLMEKLGC